MRKVELVFLQQVNNGILKAMFICNNVKYTIW